MATLTVRGAFRYTHQAARDEIEPIRVLFYVDRHFEREPVAFENPHLSAPVEGGTGGGLPFEVTGRWPLQSHQVLPHDAKLCVQVYASTMNDQGVRCLQDCGALHISLHTLTKHQKVTGPILLKTRSQPMIKGQIALEIASLTLDGRPLTFGPVTPDMNVKANVAQINAALEPYLRGFMNEQRQYEIIYTGTQSIDCPLDPSEVTVANTQLKVPFPVYLMYETAKIDADWWHGQLAILADRQGHRTLGAYARWFQQQPLAMRASQAIQLCAQYVQQTPYVSDKTAGEAIEMFGDLLAMACGDCEDGACAICQQVSAFQKETPTHADPQVSQIYTDMRTALGLYEPIFTILGVTSSHVENAPGGKQPDVSGAHAAVFFLPRDYYAQLVANWSTQHPVAQRVIGQHRTISDHLGRVGGEPLPVLVGEGTGILEPGAQTDPYLPQRKLVGECPGVGPGTIKKALYNGAPGTASSFYKVLLFGVSPTAAARGERTLTWRFTQLQADGCYSKGVRFEQVMARDPTLALVPYGGTAYGLAHQLEREVHTLSPSELQRVAEAYQVAPQALFEESSELLVGRALADVRYRRTFRAGGGTTRNFYGHAKWWRELHLGDEMVHEETEGEEFTAYQLRIMTNVAKTRMPPPRFRAGVEPALQRDRMEPRLDAVVMAAGGRRAAGVPGTAVIHEYLQPDQLEQPQLLRAIAAHIRQNQAQIVGFDYTYEWHSEALQAWRLNFYCKTD